MVLNVTYKFNNGYSHRYTLEIKRLTSSTATGEQESLIEAVVITDTKVNPSQNNASGRHDLIIKDSKENLAKMVNKELNETFQKYYNGKKELLSGSEFGVAIEPKVFRWSSNLEAYEAELTCTEQKNSTSYSITYKLDIFKGEWLGVAEKTLGETLSPTVGRWYYTIRNFVLVVMMVILLYIGIRIIISGVSSEKAKYKNMLVDWVVAICLVFVMHYIMSFAMNVVDGITSVFST